MSQNATESHDVGAGISRFTAQKFSERWQDATSEKQDAQSFWREFFAEICGITDIREAGIEFEKSVISSKKGSTNYIDVYWKGVALIEHKSSGKDLDQAEKQAREYVVSLPPGSRPPVIIVSDFRRIRIVEYLINESHEFPLADLPNNLDRVANVLIGDIDKAIADQVIADQVASKLMADLYVELEKNGYEGHEASVFLVRILFCLFADDTGMWKKQIFQDFLLATMEDGSGVGARIQSLFEILNTPKERRPKVMDEQLLAFPYVNGDLFAEPLPTFFFTREMRTALINASRYDWSSINPTIFGSLFQAIKSREDRRLLGEHYTTEEAINKVLDPIIFDELNQTIASVWDDNTKLRRIKESLGKYQFLDPACGSGNFLITAYKRLRELELETIVRIKQLEDNAGQVGLLDGTMELSVSLNQFHGIEIEEWSSQIATVAMFLTDHQMNMQLETVLGYAPDRFPLSKNNQIIHGDALNIDWKDVCPVTDTTLVVSNPPFLGASWQSNEQKEQKKRIWKGVQKAGDLDFVANWFVLAAKYINGTRARVGLVSTNSIVQGQAPAILWSGLKPLDISIDFAHRTFVWQSDARGVAAVHCIIIGFSQSRRPKNSPRFIWDYENGKGKPLRIEAKEINAYLLDAPFVLVKSRRTPLSDSTPQMNKGSQPTDGGYLSNIDESEALAIQETDPIAAKYLRPLIGGQEFIRGKKRFCLWLVNADPSDLLNSKELRERISRVREMRLASSKGVTRKDARRPSLFQEIRQPTADFIAVPEVSSERREYVPIGLFSVEYIPTNKIQVIEKAPITIFSILTSKVFTVWVRAVSGRLKSDFSISSEITYNNFPFPELISEQSSSLTDSGENILKIRSRYRDTPLAVLNNPSAMPVELLEAHIKNDNLVLGIFGLSKSASESDILASLFTRYSDSLNLAD